jgi:glyoxylase-like metal-dependent hydrolase (beta-lactamase superfamily II)
MAYFICSTCGTQYAASFTPPEVCRICSDQRQYIGANGQEWTLLEIVQQTHHNTFTALLPGLTSIVTEPGFAIGQRAHWVETPHGNYLWDCIALIDQATIDAIQAKGGLNAIALSHPHYYSTIVEWSRAFGDIPVYIHAADREWVTRPDEHIRFWEGESHALTDGLSLVRCRGHFPGSTVLHWADGADGKGVLLTGDTISVVADRRWASFMYSYPNDVPLSAAAVRHIAQTVAPLKFDQVYDAFGRIVQTGGNAAIQRSAERYLAAIEGKLPGMDG